MDVHKHKHVCSLNKTSRQCKACWLWFVLWEITATKGFCFNPWWDKLESTSTGLWVPLKEPRLALAGCWSLRPPICFWDLKGRGWSCKGNCRHNFKRPAFKVWRTITRNAKQISTISKSIASMLENQILQERSNVTFITSEQWHSSVSVSEHYLQGTTKKTSFPSRREFVWAHSPARCDLQSSVKSGTIPFKANRRSIFMSSMPSKKEIQGGHKILLCYSHGL